MTNSGKIAETSAEDRAELIEIMASHMARRNIECTCEWCDMVRSDEGITDEELAAVLETRRLSSDI